MPQYVKYAKDGRYSKPNLSYEVARLFGLRGAGLAMRSDDPLVDEEEQNRRLMAQHWIRRVDNDAQDKPEQEK